MSRILDALRKAQTGRAAKPAPAVTPLPPPPVTHVGLPAGARASAALPVPAPDSERLAEARRAIVPLGVRLELPPDVTREMTALRVSLEVALADRLPRAVMLVSSQGGEGTSTVALQFATLLAASRLRVLLVDTHLRRPAPWATAPVRPLHAADTDGGEPPPADVLALPESLREGGVVSPVAMREILDGVSGSYDWLVLDGPPVLESPDAGPLSAVADGVVVVVRAGRTKRPVLARAVELLRKAGGRVVGSVLNRRRLEIPEFIYRRI